MKKRFFSKIAMALTLCAVTGAHATIIYQDDFSGGSGIALNGLALDIDHTGVGNTWVGGGAWKADGSVSAGANTSATLAFVPAAGNLYQLDITLDVTDGTTGDWVGAGFAKGQSTQPDDVSNRFLGSAILGKAWSLVKANSATAGAGNTAYTSGTTSPVLFTAPWDKEMGEMDLRIVLDTNPETWTATWYAKLTTESEYTVMRAKTALTDLDIDSVGFATSSAAAQINSFTLQNILLADDDGDGLPDFWEQQIIDFDSGDGITNIWTVLPGDNFDGDPFTNQQEYDQGSNPTFFDDPDDTDTDGLSDAWEWATFGTLSQTAMDDFDDDWYTNEEEFIAGTDPKDAQSYPLADDDEDGLPDFWERRIIYFDSGDGITNIWTVLPSDNFDGDSFTNQQEYDQDSNPTVFTDPDDVDADGLPDAWELATFGSLAQTATDDFDGDWYTNEEELAAGTDPKDAQSYPTGLRLRLVPVSDGNPNTSEYARAGGINTASFIRSSIMTVGNHQFMTYYGRHETDANHAFNDTLWVARRTVGSNVWEVFRTSFTAYDITDGHDCISFGIDGLGYMHISWGMHADRFHYARSLGPVTTDQPIHFGPDLRTMTGTRETLVTYPRFLNLPNGDLIFIYRFGGSGNGDRCLNRYRIATQTWSVVHSPFIKGRNWTPNYNAYLQKPCVDENGNIHLAWMWRYNADSPTGESGYQTNHDFNYAWSPDGGTTWKRSNGTNYTLPINERGENGNTNSIAEKVLSIPEGYSLINQAGMCMDRSNQPALASWWAPGTITNNYRRQYMVGFTGTNGWETRQISFRTIDPIDQKIAESELRTSRMGRPTIICDKDDRLIVLYKDNEGTSGITVTYSLPKAIDPERLLWTTFELTTNSVGAIDAFHVDDTRWEQDNQLQLFYLSPSTGNSAAPIGVLEWDVAAYFAHQPAQQLSFTNGGADALITFSTQTGWEYRLWSCTNLTENTWQKIDTISGNDEVREIIHTNGGAGPQKFWQLEIKEGFFAD